MRRSIRVYLAVSINEPPANNFRLYRQQEMAVISLWTLLGAFATLAGSLGYLAFPAALEFGIKSFINLKEDGMVFPAYANPPVSSQASFYVYEVKNPREVLQGDKLLLNLKGPYKYDAFIQRDNIAFSPRAERVKFDSHRKLYLDEQKSENLDEKFWILNPILPSTQKSVKSMVIDRIPFQRVSEPIVFNAVNVLLDNYKERLFQKRSPRELLNGRKVELLQALEDLAGRFGLKSLLPPGPPENTFGLVHFQNNTVDVIEIWTGVGDSNKYGDVYKWKGLARMNVWSGKCNEINGTNGELYKPFVVKGKPLRIFLSQLCRTFHLDPVSKDVVTIQDGLKALEYEISPRLYLGARSNPANKCYCTDTSTYDCQYDGLVSMGPCFFDAPFFFAKANFKDVDARIKSLVNEDSFKFDLPQKQSFWLDVTTGSVLKVDLTLAANFKMVKQPYMRDMAKLQDLTYAPFIVANEALELPYSLTAPIKYLQVMTEYYKPFYFGLACCGVGILFVRFLGARKK